MNAVPRDIPDGSAQHETGAFFKLAADDLRLLARLHDRELTPALLEEMRRTPFAASVALAPLDDVERAAFAVLDEALQSAETDGDPSRMDLLHADFAAIYLNHTFSVSPNEGVWLDPEGLDRQEPMFEVRRWYQHYGMKAANWRMRPDDHIALQLEFVALLLVHEAAHGPKDAAAFLDHHLLRWIEIFAARVAGRCNTQFYAGVALVTVVMLRRLREALVVLADMPLVEMEPIEEEKRRRRDAAQASAAAPFVLGAAPSW